MTETERVNENRGNDAALYGELLDISRDILPKFLGKRVYARYSETAREEIIHDATARLMERIRRRGDEYKIKYIRSVVRNEIKHQVRDPKRIKWDQVQRGLIFPKFPDKQPATIEDDRYAFADLLDLPDGKRIILEIYFARSFKSLVLRLATFKTRGWIYDHAGAISSVYKNTRAMKCRERKKGRLSGSPGISPLTRILTRPFRST